MNIESPITKAERIARELDSDPIAARQVKEFISEERLITILECGASWDEVDALSTKIEKLEEDNDELRREISRLEGETDTVIPFK